ncbi:hypothetical protein Acsp04_48930 [Actinomadura sp. NBRC 104425]|uniref:hypothetical protein n=1 Tax=Actinomadura sp. NBRC 104425 TaxID=3032204 RepID=UPI0024A3E892|nr:hypothetical protein [Actinomadura sp. NBRC 104425]GLZ14658.1 hypothetical protein Acsp04_48930 [Actinomadura sp. NBRC 104425]
MTVFAVLAFLALALCVVFTFATLSSGTSQINASANCGTGRDADMGCYAQAEIIQRGQVADREANVKIGMTFTLTCGFAALTLAACAVAFGANRGPSDKGVSVAFPGSSGAPGGAAFPQPQPGAPQPGAPQPGAQQPYSPPQQPPGGNRT